LYHAIKTNIFSLPKDVCRQRRKIVSLEEPLGQRLRHRKTPRAKLRQSFLSIIKSISGEAASPGKTAAITGIPIKLGIAAGVVE